MKKKKNSSRSSIAKRASIPLVLVLGIGLFVLFSISLVKESLRGWEIQQEIESLENDVSELHQENSDLSNLLTRIQTSSWEEKEARTKLGLSKKGETVVLLPTQPVNQAPSDQEELKDDPISLPNPMKWWYYFTRY